MQPRIIGARYVLAVNNLERSATFYKSKLGFQTAWEGQGWQFLYRDSVNLMLGECPDEIPASGINCHSYFAYWDVADIDELYRTFQANGVEILSGLENKAWGQREFSIRTIDGHRITLGSKAE